MPKALLILALILALGCHAQSVSHGGKTQYSGSVSSHGATKSAWPTGYSYGATFTVNSSQITGTLTNWTPTISGTYADFADVAHGGKIQNSGSDACGSAVAHLCPFDLIFSSSADGSVLYKWEIANWDNTTGYIEAFPGPGTFAVGTVVYAFYDNPSVVSFQGGTRGSAWYSAVQARLHLDAYSALGRSDSSANANNGTDHAGSTVAGVVGGATHLDGTVDYQRIPMTSVIQLTTAGSLEIWVKPDVLAGSPIRTSEDGYGFEITIESDGSFLCDTHTNNGWEYVFSATGAVSTGVWTHLGCTYDGSYFRAYVNGALSGSPNAATGTFVTWSANAAIGNSDYALQSAVDEALFTNTALSAAQIAADYNNQVSNSGFWTAITGITP